MLFGEFPFVAVGVANAAALVAVSVTCIIDPGLRTCRHSSNCALMTCLAFQGGF